MTAIGIFLIAIFVGFITLIKYAEKLELKIDDDWKKVVEVINKKIYKSELIKDYINKEINITSEENNLVNHSIKRIRLANSFELKFKFYIELNSLIIDMIEKYKDYPQVDNNHTFLELLSEYDDVNIIDSINAYNDDIDLYNKYIHESFIRLAVGIFNYKDKDQIDISIFENIKRTNQI